MKPLVSIHIITFKHENFIADAIESALAQDYRPLQIVVGDDASPDRTGAIVEDYAKRYPNEVVAITQPHVGVLENANRVLRACTGKYVAILNGDDLYLPGKISRQVEWMEADTRRVFCGHAVETFDSESGRSLGIDSRVTSERGVGARNFLEHGCPFATVSVMLRASAIPSYGFDQRMRAALDFKMWLDVLGENGVYGAIDGTLAKYRVHGTSFSATRADEMNVDFHVARAAFEAMHPALVPASFKGRASRFVDHALAHLAKGDDAEARRLALAAFKLAPTARTFATAAWVHSPHQVRNVIQRLRGGGRSGR